MSEDITRVAIATGMAVFSAEQRLRSLYARYRFQRFARTFSAALTPAQIAAAHTLSAQLADQPRRHRPPVTALSLSPRRSGQRP